MSAVGVRVVRRCVVPGCVALALFCAAAPAWAQSADERAASLDPAVVTAERVRTAIGAVTGSVTRLERDVLARLPGATFGDLLRYAPGFSLTDTDGLGFDPQVMVRGFHGGGEAEYVIVLVDGKPVQQIQTGLVAWDALPPLASVEAIEIVRGGSSSVYGDAAIGGVINVITRAGAFGGAAPRAPRDITWDASAGAFGTQRFGFDIGTPVGRTAAGGRLSASAGLDRTDGFRDHAGRQSTRAQLGWRREDTDGSSLAIALRSHVRRYDDPGPLPSIVAEQNRSASDVFYRFDRTRDADHVLSVDHARMLGRVRATGFLMGELRDVESVRTLALSEQFADTKERVSRNMRAQGIVQVELPDLPFPGRDHVLLGAEVGRGTLDSRYYTFASGTRDDYTAGMTRGALDAEGDGARLTTALYGQYAVTPHDRWRVTLGGRYDRLADRYDVRQPAPDVRHTTTHAAFSPKVGASYTYRASSRGRGSVYGSASRSFKAPTLDQLYDQRSVGVPFPPFSITTSNPELRAQHGVAMELGMQQSAAFGAGAVARMSLATYQMDMRDELDFDVATFRYVNLGRSRHRGIESGARVDGRAVSAALTYTLQEAVTGRGDNAGRRLKAIPLHTASAELSVRPLRRAEALEGSLFVSHARDIFLDDANARRLPDWTRVDARVSARVAGGRVYLDVRNLLDTRYVQGGFPDPGGTEAAFLFPAAGRVINLGVRRGL